MTILSANPHGVDISDKLKYSLIANMMRNKETSHLNDSRYVLSSDAKVVDAFHTRTHPLKEW